MQIKKAKQTLFPKLIDKYKMHRKITIKVSQESKVAGDKTYANYAQKKQKLEE